MSQMDITQHSNSTWAATWEPEMNPLSWVLRPGKTSQEQCVVPRQEGNVFANLCTCLFCCFHTGSWYPDFILYNKASDSIGSPIEHIVNISSACQLYLDTELSQTSKKHTLPSQRKSCACKKEIFPNLMSIQKRQKLAAVEALSCFATFRWISSIFGYEEIHEGPGRLASHYHGIQRLWQPNRAKPDQCRGQLW